MQIQIEALDRSGLLTDIVGPQLFPPRDATNAEVDEWIRNSVQTQWHPVGTIRMGTDAAAPVDERLAVRGAGRLSVVDASVMPVIPRGNTQAPTIMIAERAAAFINAR